MKWGIIYWRSLNSPNSMRHGHILVLSRRLSLCAACIVIENVISVQTLRHCPMPRQNQEYRELFEDAEDYTQTMLAPKLLFTVLRMVSTFISAKHIHYSALCRVALSGRSPEGFGLPTLSPSICSLPKYCQWEHRLCFPRQAHSDESSRCQLLGSCSS